MGDGAEGRPPRAVEGRPKIDGGAGDGAEGRSRIDGGADGAGPKIDRGAGEGGSEIDLKDEEAEADSDMFDEFMSRQGPVYSCPGVETPFFSAVEKYHAIVLEWVTSYVGEGSMELVVVAKS